MKVYGGVDVQIHIFFPSALAGGDGSASRTFRFTFGEGDLSAHSIGVWVGPRASLDDTENRKFLTLPGLELRPLGRPACSQSLILTTLSRPIDIKEDLKEIGYVILDSTHLATAGFCNNKRYFGSQTKSWSLRTYCAHDCA
jgi:hypothetical protein